MQRQLSILACLARSTSSQQILFNSSICLAIFCLIFSEDSISQFQFSIQADFVSLSLICPSTCLVWLKSLRFKILIDLLKSKSLNFSFQNFLLNLSLSFIQFSLSHHLFSDGRVNFPFNDFFGDFLCLSAHAQHLCLDLSSLSTVN